MSHGTRSGYTNDGCRCALCRQAQAAYMREYRKRLRGHATVPEGEAPASARTGGATDCQGVDVHTLPDEGVTP